MNTKTKTSKTKSLLVNTVNSLLPTMIRASNDKAHAYYCNNIGNICFSNSVNFI